MIMLRVMIAVVLKEVRAQRVSNICILIIS